MKYTVLTAMALCLGMTAGAKAADTNFTWALARNTITAGEETFSFAVPKQLGYFKEEKLNPSILYTDGSTAAIQAVASGSADVGEASSANIAAAIEKGVPIKAFAGFTVQWPYFIAVPKGSAIKSLADLKGKRIGVISLASASYADLRANLKIAGLKETDVTIVPVGAGARAAAALKANQIDAVDSYSDSFTVMGQNGIELTFLKRPDEMSKLFSVTMITSDKTLKTKPEELAGFMRAAYKGIIYTKLYPESALKLSFAEFPQLAGANDPNGEAAKNTLAAMKIALADSIPADKPDPATWGEWLNLPADRWEAVLNFALDTGQIEKKMTVAQVWDGSLMPKIYDFDEKKIVEKK
ncbi:MAG: ABC transporter substrate-binding protein [Rhizobiales bacterium]|nr:ABC transporter substrate-binding protein [Hyphomicrobiales bacterium]